MGEQPRVRKKGNKYPRGLIGRIQTVVKLRNSLIK